MTDVEVFVDPELPVGVDHDAVAQGGGAAARPGRHLAVVLPRDPRRLRRRARPCRRSAARPRSPRTRSRTGCCGSSRRRGPRSGKMPSTRCSRRGAGGSSRAARSATTSLLAECLAACGLDARPHRRGRRREVGRADRRSDGGRLRVRRSQDADADDRRARRSAARLQGPGDGARADRRSGRCACGTRSRCSREEPGFFEITRPRRSRTRRWISTVGFAQEERSI